MSDFTKLPYSDVWARKSMIAFIQVNKKDKIIQVCLQGEHEPFDIELPTSDEYNKTLQMLLSN
jgi:hypothetical protein